MSNDILGYFRAASQAAREDEQAAHDDVLKGSADNTGLTIEGAFQASKDVAYQRLGVSTEGYLSPTEELKAAMVTIYGDGSGAFRQDEAGNITLTKKPSLMTDTERTSLMKAIRSNVHSKYGVEG
ncbi:hypothetical protein [uncultured Roseibium sp.]|uniref:hypothetical protein n=1 Tax=uncultured Roseibium sp. TaxID=1936171 RepID=UPI003216F146